MLVAFVITDSFPPCCQDFWWFSVLFPHDYPDEPSSSDMDVAKPTDATFIISSTWLGVHGHLVPWTSPFEASLCS